MILQTNMKAIKNLVERWSANLGNTIISLVEILLFLVTFFSITQNHEMFKLIITRISVSGRNIFIILSPKTLSTLTQNIIKWNLSVQPGNYRTLYIIIMI